LFEERKFLRVLSKQSVSPPPVWLMRQAGRYLPEYRELRTKAGSFWTMAMTPELACEITLQPIRRFGFDAAILFSDILVVPFALGLPVTFVEGEGPRLPAINSVDGLIRDPQAWLEALRPVYDGLAMTRAKLDAQTPLIGFAGAPWTLATYMAAGRGKDEQRAAKLWGYGDPLSFDALLDILVECVAFHLIRQLEAGADAVQIFDSWASGLPAAMFECWVIEPTRRIVEKVRTAHPDAKIIGFPRASTLEGYERYAQATKVDAISIDTAAPIHWAVRTLGGGFALQGNLDPIALIAGGDALLRATDEILDATRGLPFVFNLGHGILPDTPIAHVEQLLTRIRSAR
jgi:uroporphyrinogen decarboxylase